MLVLSTLVDTQDATSTATTEPRPAEITINESTTLQIVGFGDLLATYNEENDGQRFEIGQAEVDLESELTDRFTIALAIAYDKGNFTIGAFTANYEVWSASESSPSIPGVNNFAVGGGQYDVPLGNKA